MFLSEKDCDFQVFQHFRQSKFQALQNAQNQQCEKVNNVVFLKTHKVGSGHTHLLSPNSLSVCQQLNSEYFVTIWRKE